MSEYPASQAREQLSELINKAAYGKERVINPSWQKAGGHCTY